MKSAIHFVSLLMTLLCTSFSTLAAPTSQSQHVAIPLKMQTGASLGRSSARYGQNQYGLRDDSAVEITGYATRLVGQISVGEQNIWVMLDTGSPVINLDASAYTPGPSAINTHKPISPTYGQGGEGDVAQIYLDAVKLGSTTTDNVPILDASQNWFHDATDPAQGIFGLSFPFKSDNNQPNVSTFLEHYFEQNPNQKQQFATWISNATEEDANGFNETQAMLYLGGYDSSKFSGSLTYTDVVVPHQGWWQIPSGGRINHQDVPIVIDSGTQTILAPTFQSLQQFANNLNLTAFQGSFNAFIPVSCSAKPISVSFNNLTREIPHLSPFDGFCILPVRSFNTDTTTANGNWIFGFPVYQQFFILHDYQNKRAGFAIPNQ